MKYSFMLILLLFVGCGGSTKFYVKKQYPPRKNIIITMHNDPKNWKEDWRMAFNDVGYNVSFSDEVKLNSRIKNKNKIESNVKKEAIIAPLSSLGNISNIEKKIFWNALNEGVSKYFLVASNDRFEKAQEQAFQELEYDECTEDQCIMIIQELLQVPYFFQLEVINEKNNIQLSLKLNTLDGKVTKTDFCIECNSIQLSKKIINLSEKVFQEINQSGSVSSNEEVEDSFSNLDFTLSYTAQWDLIWYVENVNFSVIDVSIGETIANFREENFWAHPSVSQVVDEINEKVLSNLWKR